MGKLLPLESLRGLAALTVVIFHFGVGSHFNNPFTLNGFLLVDFFFVLSGFVIALSYLHRLSNITSLLTFQKKRFWRLYPLHLLMLVVFFGFNLAKYILSDQIQFAKPAFSEDFFLEFLFNLLLLHNWVLPTLTLNVPSWSISAEFFTYLIFGITVLFVKNRTFFCTISAIFVITSGYLLFQMGWQPEIGGPLRCIYGFFIGVIMYLIHESSKKLTFTSSIPGVMLLCVSIWSIYNGTTYLDSYVFLPPLFGLVVMVISKTAQDTAISKILSHKTLVWLGTISYGVYMIHYAVIFIIGNILMRLFGVPFLPGVGYEFSSVWIADLIMIVAIAATLLLAHLSHTKLEKPLYFKNGN